MVANGILAESQEELKNFFRDMKELLKLIPQGMELSIQFGTGRELYCTFAGFTDDNHIVIKSFTQALAWARDGAELNLQDCKTPTEIKLPFRDLQFRIL